MASKKAVNSKPKKKQEVVEDEDEILDDEDELLDEDEDEDELDDDDEDSDDEDEDEDELEEDDDEDSDDEDEDEDELEEEDEDEEEEDDEDSDDEDEDEDELEEDDDDDEDSDDEDEDEDELEEDDEDEEEEDDEDEKPVKKSKAAPAKKSASKKSPAKKETSKKDSKKSAKKSAPKKAPAKGFDDYWSEVEAKVEKWNGGAVTYVDGNKVIPQSPVVSDELLMNLVATFNESEAWKNFFKKIALKTKIADSDDLNSLDYNVTGNDVTPVVKSMFEVFLQLITAESGFHLFKTDECVATLRGSKVEGSITNYSHLNVSKGREWTKIEDYVKVICNSPAPANKKVIGTMNGKKFVPYKESSDKKESGKKAAAPAKKDAKKTSKKKK